MFKHDLLVVTRLVFFYYTFPFPLSLAGLGDGTVGEGVQTWEKEAGRQFES